MNRDDVLKAKDIVELFLQKNGIKNIYTQPSSQNTYGVYIDWTVKNITIHGPNSTYWQNALQHPSNIGPNIFKDTKNGLWIGPFPSFINAFTFSELLRKTLYLNTHEEVLLSSSSGITNTPFRIF